MRFAGRRGPKLDRSLVGADRKDGTLRTVRRQAPIAWRIDLRGSYTLAALQVEPVRFLPLGAAVHADR
jgi:hypothetical protein